MEQDTKSCPFCAEEVKFAAIKCKHCGSDLGTSALQTTQNVQVKTDSPRLPNVCPACHEASAVQKVSVVLDSSTTNSIGLQALTQLAHPLNAFAGISASTSSTNLTSRFRIIVPEAEFQMRWLGVGVILSLIYLKVSWFAPGQPFDTGNEILNYICDFFVSIFLGPAIGACIGYYVKHEQKKEIAPVQQKRLKAIQTVRESFYCFRDDLVFNDKTSGTPEAFIRNLI